MRSRIKNYAEEDFDKNLEPYRRSCAMNFEDINLILEFYKQKPLDGEESFFLATCNSDPAITRNLEGYGAHRVKIIFNFCFWWHIYIFLFWIWGKNRVICQKFSPFQRKIVQDIPLIL